jgi:signal transduction histidine kinase
VFASFFTRRRGGTGSAFSIVQQIVEQHAEASRPQRRDGGACVVVWLPLGAPPG